MEQEQYLYPGQRNHPYFYFKGHEVHKMMCHSFFGYKEGFDVHHKNENKLNNQLDNLMYLTREQHVRLHMIGKKLFLGKKHSTESKEKIIAGQKRKKVYCLQLNKVFDSIHAAARELKLFQSNITHCLQGKYKSTGGYHFSYYTGDQK